MKTETERMSDHAIKRMVEQLYDDLIAVGNIVRHAYGEREASNSLMQVRCCLIRTVSLHGFLVRSGSKPGRITLDVHAELARRQTWLAERQEVYKNQSGDRRVE